MSNLPQGGTSVSTVTEKTGRKQEKLEPGSESSDALCEKESVT